MYRLAVLSLFFLLSCTASRRIIYYSVSTRPVYKIDPAPQKILLINIIDIPSKKYRDNKEELFISFVDSLMYWAADRIKILTGTPAEAIRGYTPTSGNTDSTVSAIITRRGATHAIVIYSFDIYFEQTHVDVTKDNSGTKNRTAYYDIVADIGFSFYSAHSLIKEMDVHQRHFHSSRSVISGVLAAGPNVVAKRNDAANIMLVTGQQYLRYFFPGEARRSRPLFTGKGFEAVGTAIVKNDYEAALTESLHIMNNPDKAKAAKGSYNCAVLFERKNQQEEALNYLRQSLSFYPLPEARLMLADLGE